VWILGSNPENRCFLEVTVKGRRCNVQIKRNTPLQKLMELIKETGRIKTVEIGTHAIQTEDMSPGHWPNMGWVTIQTHKPKEEVTLWAWEPTIILKNGHTIEPIKNH
jgi:hypothetical protein